MVADLRPGSQGSNPSGLVVLDHSIASPGNDVLTGTPGPDTISGRGGNDVIFGLGGNDKLHGNQGNDTIRGGAGNDSIGGDKGNDHLFGGSGRDVVVGGDGNDVLSGLSGNDRLFGGAGRDRLKGDAGNDRLVGGTGRDELHGGSGNDRFVFANVGQAGKGTNRDVIVDFRHNHDKIDIGLIDANSHVGGNQAFHFINAAAFSGHGAEVRYAGGVLHADVNGDRVDDFQIGLENHSLLTAHDFIL